MDNVFEKPFCLISPEGEDGYISLFDKMEDIEYYQLNMGLQALCQNTLIYPTFLYGKTEYHTRTSPNADQFYVGPCQRFRESCQGDNLPCNEILMQIAAHFCEKKPLLPLIREPIDYRLIPYNPEKPSECYIRYQCPFVPMLIKFGFPVFVNGVAIAILFTGQFSINGEGPSIHKEGTHQFQNEEELSDFVNSMILKIIRQFSERTQENLYKKQIELLDRCMKKHISHMEEKLTSFLMDMTENLSRGADGTFMQRKFWELVLDGLKPYLEQIGVSRLLFFVEEQQQHRQTPRTAHGIQLYPTLEQRTENTFDFQKALSFYGGKNSHSGVENRDTGAGKASAARSVPELSNLLLSCFHLEDQNFSKEKDVQPCLAKVQPFAMAVYYRDDSDVIQYPFYYRQRVLAQLEEFFEKVVQELAYFSILMSEHTTKTVLRIYRHEIAHQLQILEHNNWFLNPARLRITSAEKLELIGDDQRQCLDELDFMTQNIDVVTGRINSRVANVDRERLIDVRKDLLNKVVSLYKRKKREKTLWFSVQNQSVASFLNANLELLDLIFFNLLSNAIKYCHPGTNIIIKFEDTDIHARHRISLTDFGVEAKADYPEQIFQMYFRGHSHEFVEGSGLGLYVAHTVAEILGAKISWNCNRISDYNIPILVRYIGLSPKERNKMPIDYAQAHEEYSRLVNNAQLNWVFNGEYEMNPEQWSRSEIIEELTQPTFAVTFMLDI